MAVNYDQREKEEFAKKKLEKYAKDWKIFIDTCSMLEDTATFFWYNIKPYLKQYKNKVIVAKSCIDELLKHMRNRNNPELSEKSLKCLSHLDVLRDEGFVDFYGDLDDNAFADNVFLSVFTKKRMKYKLLLITQDHNLTADVLNLRVSKSDNKDYTNSIDVQRINKFGFLANPKMPLSNSGSNNHVDVKDEEETPSPNEVFRICNAVTSITDSQLNGPNYTPPKENETVYTTQGPIKLMSQIAAGGEGIIYTTNTQYVAKIYKKASNTKIKYEKIKKLLDKGIWCEGICFPVAALYNFKKEFVGYLMPMAKGKELQKSIFIKQLFLKNFPDWKKRDTVELCVTILEKIKYLHDRNIILGDINPLNILVVSPKEVYFVDTDSYQIEDYPCPVGTINYTAPEIQRKEFRSFLRTKGNENFAVATLLFMIMLPGKPPYSQQGGEDPVENIINMDFSYPFGDNTNKKTPDGPWRFIWSHQTYRIKESFYNTFRKGGKNSSESTRLSVDDWKSLFQEYLYLLDNGILREQDKMSEELFPNRHKKNINENYIICQSCGSEVPEGRSKNGICYDCRNKVKETRTCVVCGNQFDITTSEYDYYINRGLILPHRCKDCRAARK